MIEQALAGYKALPADTAADWRKVFGFPANSRPTLDQVDSAYKAAARLKHPDVGGTEIESSCTRRRPAINAPFQTTNLASLSVA